jgi:methyl-accepting chemotaxis protein
MPVRLVDPDFDVISVAPIQTVRRVVEDVSETKEDFMGAINKLAKQVDRIAVTNLSLQAKMTDLLIRVTDMIKHMESMINLLQKASEFEGEAPEIKANIEPVTNELKKLNIQTEELKAKMGDMTEYMRKVYTRQLLGRVVEKR